MGEDVVRSGGTEENHKT